MEKKNARQLIICAVILFGFLCGATAANVTLKSSDPLGRSSWSTNGSTTTSTNWSDGAVPSVANDYLTAFTLRTPNPATNAAAGTNPPPFAGLSLSIDAGGQLLTKHFGNFTNSHLKLNGGSLFLGDVYPVTNWGTINLVANSTLSSDGARMIDIKSAITNSALLTVSFTNPAAPATVTNIFSGSNSFVNVNITNGALLRANSTNAFGQNSGTIGIGAGSTLDLNGIATNLYKAVYVQGVGAAGQGGAIVNNGAGTVNNGIRGAVTLAGNTTFGGSGRWDIASPATLIGSSFKLTKIGGNEIALGNLGNPGLGDIDVAVGILTVLGNTTLGNSANTASIGSGASLQFFGVNSTISTPIAKNVVVTNTGNINNNSGSTFIAGTVTLQGIGNFAGGGTAATFLGPIGGPGSVVKSGVTMVSLLGTNTFSGNIIVNQGWLALGPPATIYPAPLITVVSNSTLDVTAIPGGLTLANNALFLCSGTVTGSVVASPGSLISPNIDGIASTMMITNGSLTLNHLSGLHLDLSSTATTAGGGTNDVIVINGDLNLSGTNIITFVFNGIDGPLLGVPYPFIKYSGVLNGSVANLVGLAGNYTATFDTTTVPGEVSVSFIAAGTAANLVWKGDGFANLWDINNTMNWLNGGNPDVFLPGDTAIFDDTGSNNVPVILSGNISPAAVNATANKDYTLSGSGSILSGSLNKSGAGTLTIANSNTYSGGTYVSEGRIKIGTSNALGITGGTIVVTNGGQVDLNAVDQSLKAFTYITSGSGPDGQGAIKQNNPVLDLTGVRSGIKTLVMVGDTTLGTMSNRFDIGQNGGYINGNGYKMTKVGTFHMPFRTPSVSNISELIINAGRVYSELYSMQLTGLVTINPGGFLGAYSYNNTANPTWGVTNSATINLNGGSLGAEGAQSAVTNNLAVWTGPVNVNADSFLNAAQSSANAEAQIEGTLNGTANLTVMNTAATPKAMTLAADNNTTYSGNVTVNSGNILRLGGAAGTYGSGYVTNLGTVEFRRTTPSSFGSSTLLSSNGTVIHQAGSEQLTITGSAAIGLLVAQSTNAAKPLVIGSGANLFLNGFSVPRDFSYGKVQIDPGSTLRVWSPSGGFYLGDQASRTGEVFQAGGDVTVDGTLRIAHWPTESSSYTLAGGTLTLPAIAPAAGENPGMLIIGVDGIGAFRQTGGFASVAGVWLDSRGDSPGTDSFALEGGTFTVGPIGITSTNPSVVAYLGGGTLVASASWASGLPFVLSGTNGNVTLDSGLNTITLSSNLTGPGGFNKTGGGTLVLSGSSLFTNFSTVSQGLVLANGQVGTNTSRIDVNGGTLGGSGNVRPAVAVNAGGGLTGGTNGVAGTLTISNNVSLADQARLIFDLTSSTTTGGGVNDLIVVRSNLTLSGTIPADFNFLSGIPNTATPYTIMQYGGTLTGTANNLTNRSHYTATFGAASGNVTVQFSGSGSNLIWVGDGLANLWDAGGAYNWTNGVSMDFFGAGDTVTFDDTGSNAAPVSLAGNLAPASITVNANNDYNFAGDGRIVGAASITKSGTGTLLLTNANSQTGSLLVNGGTVVIGGDASLGTAPLAYTPGKLALNGGTLAVNGTALINPTRGIAVGPAAGSISVPAGAVLSYGGIVTNSASGAGSLVKSGQGNLRLTSANAYTGNTIISQGGVQILNNLALGINNSVVLGDASTGSSDVSLLIDGQSALNFTNPITVAASGSGTVRLGTTVGTATNPQFTSPLTLNRDVTLIASNSDRTTFNAPISGSGNITVAGSMRVALSATNTFSGDVFVTGNNTILQPFLPGVGTLAQTIPDTARVDLGFGAILQLHGDEAIDRLTGNGFVQPTVRNAILYVGAANGSSTFSGVLRDNAQTTTITKVGSGTFTLNARNTHTGSTVVNGGTLALGAAGSVSNSAQISVNSNGVFDVTAPGGFVLGSGKSIVGNNGSVVGNFNFAAGGILSPNGFSAAGTLNFSNNLSFDRNAVVNWNLTNDTTIGSVYNDLVNVGGDLILNGPVTFGIFPICGNLAVGTYRLINYSGALVGNATNLFISNSVASTRYTLTLDASITNQINLIVTGGAGSTLVYRGSPALPNWNLTEFNWLNGAGLDRYFNGDSVLFDDTALNSIVNLPGTVQPGPVTVDSTNTYIFTGAGKISGSASVTKNGSGAVTFGTINDFTGPLAVNGGIFKIGASNAIGNASAINVASGASIDLNGVLIQNRYTFNVGGSGPDGQGVLRNGTGSLHSGVNGSPMLNLNLTTNAVINIYNNIVVDIPYAGVLNGNGYKITKIGNGRIDLYGTITNVDELIINDGIVYQEGGPERYGTNVTVNGGGMMGLFGGYTNTAKVTLNGGQLVGTGSGAAGFSGYLNGSIFVTSNSVIGSFYIFTNSGGNIHYQINSPISGPASLTKTSTNTINIAGTNTFTGDLNIAAGRLVLLGTASFSNAANLNVSAGAVLDVTPQASFGLGVGQTLTGSGLVQGNVTDNSGAIIQPGGVSTYGTLTSSNVTLNGGATLVIDLNSVTNEGAGLNDLLAVRDLSVNGATTIKLNPLLGAFTTSGAYTLINYSGILTGTNNLTVATDASGVTVALDYSIANKIRVVFSGTAAPLPLVWLGDYESSGNSWDVALSLTWFDEAAQAQTIFHPGDTVIFNDSFNNSPTVNLVGTLAPALITVDSSTDNQFTFIGSGSLGGGGLIKKQQSTLTIANSGVNNYAGPTDIQFGTLQVGNGGTTGMLPPTTITNNGTLVFNRSDNITVPNVLINNGELVQQGGGILSLSGNSGTTYNGPITVKNGIFKPTTPLAVGSTNFFATPITVASGGIFDINGQNYGAKPVNVSGAGFAGLGAIINSGGAQINALQQVTMTGDTTIGGTNRWDIRLAGTNAILSTSSNPFKLTKVGPNQISLMGVAVDPYLGDVDIRSGILSFETTSTSLGDPTGTVNIAYGAALQLYQATNTLNKQFVLNGGTNLINNLGTNIIAGPMTMTAPSTFNIGGTSLTLNSNVSGVGPLIKIGANLLVLGASNTYTGGTIVNGGTLQVGTNTGGWILGDVGLLSGNLNFAQPFPAVFSNNIIGSAGIVQQVMGASPLTFTGTNVAAAFRAINGNLDNPVTFAAGSSNSFGSISVGLATLPALGSGAMRVEDGAKLLIGNFYLGDQNSQTGVVVQAGGEVIVGSQLRVGHWPNNLSTYLVGGGTLTLTSAPASNPAVLTANTEQNGTIYIGIDTVGFLTQTGGVITTPSIVLDGRGSTTLSGYTNTYAMEGGTLNLGVWGFQSGNFNANSTYQVLLGGGTIGSLASWSSTLNMQLTGTNGNVTIDTGIYTNTLSGALNGPGGINKSGPGMLVLSGNNTYTNATLVNGGSLINNGTLTSIGVVNVASTAVLGGSGTINAPVVLQPGATVTPGTSIGTLTINNPLALTGYTVMEISKLGLIKTNDVLRSSGTLTYGGALTVVAIANAPALAPGERFRLFDAPSYAGSFSSIVLPTLTPGLYWDTSRLAIDGTIGVGNPPSFATLSPASRVVECGSNATLTATTDASVPLTYVWMRNGEPYVTNSLATLTLSNLTTADTANFTVVLSNPSGSIESSLASVIVVDTRAPVIVSSAPAQTIDAVSCQATLADLRGLVSATDCGAITIAQVPPVGTLLGLGVTTVTFYVSDDAQPTRHTNTCTTSVMVKDPSLAVTAQPENVTNNIGSNATFTATAIGCPDLTYQWYFASNVLADATNATLTVSNIVATNAGEYFVLVANSGGSVTSSVALLVVNSNSAPVAANDGFAVQRNRSLSIDSSALLANDSDPDGDLITFVGPTSATSTNGGTVGYIGSTVTYTPAANFTGIDRFSYQISDVQGALGTGDVELYVVDGALPAYNYIALIQGTNGFTVRFNGQPGQTYDVKRSLNLETWTTVQTTQAPLHGIIEYVEPNPLPGPAAFYKIVKQ